jgi:tRNA (guanine-N7-)-methyltransferase
MLPIAPLTKDSHIRSFILRTGRIGEQAAEALHRNWPTYGLAADGCAIDPTQLFHTQRPIMLEIGFGMGDATAEMARRQRDLNLLAIDVHTPGVASLMRIIEAEDLDNLRVAHGDVIVLLRDMLAPDTLDGVRIFFPDPWPKFRHVKRRLISPEFLDLLASTMKPGAVMHLATDWAPYFDQVSKAIAAHSAFELIDEVPWRVRTKFENIGARAGRDSQDLAARKR